MAQPEPDFTRGAVLLAKRGPAPGVLGDCPFTWRANFALRARGVPFTVELVNLADKPAWFLRMAPDGTAPAFIDGETVIASSDGIVAHANEVGTEGEPLQPVVEGSAGAVASAPVFGAFVKFMKCAPEEEEACRAGLEQALRGLETHLSEAGTTFLASDKLSALDCAIAPKLHHVDIAAKHWKKFEIVHDTYPNIRAYLARVREMPAWKASACADDVVVWGWSKYFK